MRTIYAAIVLLVLAGASPTQAYRVKSTDEGLPLRWAAGVVRYHLDSDNPGPFAPDRFAPIVDAAFAAWSELPEGPLDLRPADPVQGGFGYDPAGKNASVVTWESHSWEYDPDALMLTFTHYRVSDGALVDADVLINGVDHQWAMNDGGEDREREGFDLQNSLTHEVGHFLGLAHSPDHPEATMFPSTIPGEESKRHPAEDDFDGLAYLYVTAGLPSSAGGSEDGARRAAAGCSTAACVGPGSGLALAVLLWLMRACARRDAARRRPRCPGQTSILALMTALGLLLPGLASATVLRYVSIDDLVERADVVVHGRVTAVRPQRLGRLVVTDSEIRIESCIRGSCGRTITVRQLGGELGDVGLHVSGTVRTQVGDELVVFLRRGRDGALAPLGMLQGIMRVRRVGVELRAFRDLGGLAFARGNSSQVGTHEEWSLHAISTLVRCR
jgi:hypothetical protein